MIEPAGAAARDRVALGVGVEVTVGDGEPDGVGEPVGVAASGQPKSPIAGPFV